jgi:hypothetical protein
MTGHHAQGDGELQPAAHVAEGVTAPGYAIDVLRRGNPRQERIVENIAANETDLGQNEKDQGLNHVTRRAKHQQRGEQAAPIRERKQKALLGCGIVGDRAQHRCEHEGDQRRRRHGESPQAGAAIGFPKQRITGFADHAVGEICGQQPGQHRRGVGGVGPVVYAPSEDGALVSRGDHRRDPLPCVIVNCGGPFRRRLRATGLRLPRNPRASKRFAATGARAYSLGVGRES